jgi:transposase
MMLQPEQVWLAIEPVDMRLGVDGLSLLVQEALGKAPCDGSAYAFRNKRSNRIKLLAHVAYITAASSGRTPAIIFAP